MLKWFPLFFFCSLSAEYYSPEVYSTLWSSVCYKHLIENPEACCSYHVLKGEFYLDSPESATAYFEKGLIERVQPWISFIPLDLLHPCDFYSCTACGSPIIRRILDIPLDEDDSDDVSTEVCHRCKCLKGWYEYERDRHYPEGEDAQEKYDIRTTHNEEIVEKHWHRCPNPSSENGYFLWYSQQYFHFLEQHLRYCSENPDCSCYWPQSSRAAYKISDFAYHDVKKIIENSVLSELVDRETPYDDFPYFTDIGIDGVLTSLFVQAFFYSHYRQILFDLSKFIDTHEQSHSSAVKNIDQIYNVIQNSQPLFLDLYSNCLQKHPHPKIYYERGMILMHRGEIDESLADIKMLIDYAENSGQTELLSSDLYYQEGSAYAELGLYDQAIGALSKAITLDSSNKEAYFERASAYFELGNFDFALQDYILSGLKPKIIPPSSKSKIEFSKGISLGTLEGAKAGMSEFIPSMLASLRGLGHGLWAFIQNPVAVSLDFVDAAAACIDFVKNNTTSEILQTLVTELQELVQNWDKLDQNKKGKLTGYIIGKYGVDIFAAAGITKGMTAYRNLKRANNLLTFELATLDKNNRVLIAAQALERAENRKKIVSEANLKIRWIRQNRHIAKYMKPDDTRSVFTHPNPQKLVDEFAGTGHKINTNIPGSPDYRERINFKEKIGIWKTQDGRVQKETTVGMIVYAKDGVHIIPLKPIE